MSVAAFSPLNVESGQGNYRVLFDSTVQESVEQLLGHQDARLIVDAKVKELYHKSISPLCKLNPTIEVLPTEETKTVYGAIKIWDFLQSTNTTKNSCVIAIGGGIVQDLAQFSCHNYYRGLQWRFVPTTLLAQCDSCIGAKCGLNHGTFKNQLGVFHSPAEVVICSEFLNTLSSAEIKSGYGEILKLHLTQCGSEEFENLSQLVQVGGLRCNELPQLIRRSLEIKQAVIQEDEYELNLRRILNYGHTFGHALESITNHEVPHGIAVAWGIDLVNFIALKRGMILHEHFEKVHLFIKKFLGCAKRSRVNASSLIDASRRDKKVVGKDINLILPTEIGRLAIVTVEFNSDLTNQISEYLENHDVLACD